MPEVLGDGTHQAAHVGRRLYRLAVDAEREDELSRVIRIGNRLDAVAPRIRCRGGIRTGPVAGSLVADLAQRLAEQFLFPRDALLHGLLRTFRQ
jgi:hypothetical protein